MVLKVYTSKEITQSYRVFGTLLAPIGRDGMQQCLSRPGVAGALALSGAVALVARSRLVRAQRCGTDCAARMNSQRKMTPKGQMSSNGSGPAIAMLPPMFKMLFEPRPPLGVASSEGSGVASSERCFLSRER